MSKTALFIISSPLQLMNSIEAIKYFGITKPKLLIIHIVNRDDIKKHFSRLLEFIEWDSIDYVQLPEKKLDKILFPKNIKKSLNRININNIDKIFVGDYQSNHINHIVNYLDIKDVYLIDDGMAMAVYDTYLYSKPRKEKIVDIFYKFIGYQIKPIDYTFFTFFNLKERRVIQNNFSFFRNLISQKEIKNRVYFIGQPLVELDIITRDSYIRVLQKIIDFYSDKEFIYVLHRREEESYIDIVSKELDFRYIRFDNLIELEMIFSNTIPSHFGTFYSTAILTLPKLFNKSAYHAFRIDNNILINQDLKFKEALDSCYQEFIDSDIEVKKI